ncbi:glutathione S-transferase family protein [Rhizobiaceae bacterium n13]|uniref:Glutathione S-transferase family protein n=1 Tax=Ferirhizobium litorale TaxID=2927786 RepID=A0AAE3TZY5_9HYPH|nr:glutathione S-transferase family protein [Fererhizobium litorale]MDI7861357.1 glutathione S-transferase family protein [Fererhizobium litorale]MDI7921504.1 glutathione S-transferase family protein [Fererhizobium litorale]
MITIWGRKTSSNVQSVMWCIGELGLAHERIDAGFTYGVVDTPEFLAMNPNGLVPVIRDDGGEPLWESGAIIRYLAARYGGDGFWPADPVARAPVDMWAEWAKVTVCAAFTGPIFWRVVRTPSKDRDPVAIAAAVKALDAKLAIAEARLEGHAFLAGDAFTPADIQFGHILYRYFTIDIERRPRPALERYHEALQQRPAFREHVMVSYNELRAD